MVTHEQDIAAFTKRSVVFKDGKIIKDNAIENPLLAKEMIVALPREN